MNDQLERLIICHMEYRGTRRQFCVIEEAHRIVEIRPGNPDENLNVGDICVGEIENLPANLDAAFVRIAPGLRCYLPLKDAENPLFVSGKREASEKLRGGDQLLVQVTREAQKNKLPQVSARLSVSGEYMVIHNGKKITYSHKLSGDARRRLEGIIDSLKNTDAADPADFGLVVRTNAADAPEQALKQEYMKLRDTFYGITKQGPHRSLYSCVFAAEPSFITMLKGIRKGQLSEVVTDDKIVYEEISRWSAENAPDLTGKIRLYDDRLLSLGSLIGLRSALDEALGRKVWLKCGGCIVIEQTEAFVSIDVNSGKYTSKKNPEEAFRLINLEAAEEIARQLRIRNLSGVILIDFINMKNRDHEEELMSMLRQHLKNDSVKAVVVDMTPLHIVEMTRQKTRTGLKESLFEYESD